MDVKVRNNRLSSADISISLLETLGGGDGSLLHKSFNLFAYIFEILHHEENAKIPGNNVSAFEPINVHVQ